MLRCCNFLTVLLLLSPAISVGRVPSGDSPAFTAVPELSAGFDLLYEQKFAEARQIFASWESSNQENPFGQVAVAVSYLFEECKNWVSPGSVRESKASQKLIDSTAESGQSGSTR